MLNEFGVKILCQNRRKRMWSLNLIFKPLASPIREYWNSLLISTEKSKIENKEATQLKLAMGANLLQRLNMMNTDNYSSPDVSCWSDGTSAERGSNMNSASGSTGSTSGGFGVGFGWVDGPMVDVEVVSGDRGHIVGSCSATEVGCVAAGGVRESPINNWNTFCTKMDIGSYD